MRDIFRICDRLQIAGRGTCYILNGKNDTGLHIGDILLDLTGNHFKIETISVLHRIADSTEIEDQPLALSFKLLDGMEVSGNILFRNLKDISFLFCSHPLDQHRVDEDYEEEYQSAGLHYPCALFSYEDLERGKLSLYGEDISGLTIYRGWMMKPKLYETFYSLLESKGIILINTPEEYEKYHTLPGWYKEFANQTAKSVWESEGEPENVLEMCKTLEGSYIVKDFVKSRKHEWYDACFIKDIRDKENSIKIIRNFVKRQGSDLVGGIVLRKFEKLKQIGFHEKSGMPLSEEYRVFVYAGKVMVMEDYWTENGEVKISDEEKTWIASIAQKIKSNFVTIDLARKEDGSLIIMELGDGQVSGLQQIKASDFYRIFSEDAEISAEKSLPEEPLVLTGDPMPEKNVEEMKQDISSIRSTEELIDTYVQIHNKFWFIVDDLDDYEEGTEEYQAARNVVGVWKEMMDVVDSRVMNAAKEEGLLAERQPGSGTVKQLEAFMDKYGYGNASGWWVKDKKPI